MRTVLIVAYYFPPSGGPGVQRILKMVRYLPEFCWQPVVLTVQEGTFPARDESLLSEIPPGVHVQRTRITEPYHLYRRLTGSRQPIDVAVLTSEHTHSWKQRLAQWIRATFFIPDARIGWLPSAIPAGIQLGKRFTPEVLYTSSPPYTCAVIGRALKRRLRVPWVMELRDPWTGFLTTPRRWWLPARIDRHLEHSCLTNADRVVCAWEGIMRDALGKYPHLPQQKFITIPNGFDRADYPAIEPHRNDALTITYTGSLYGLRNPAVLMAALERLVADGELPPDHVHLRLVGRVGQDVLETLKHSPLWHRIEIVPYVPHHESIHALLRSDIALLVVDRSTDSSVIVPGKVFEYLGAGKPILALAPHGSAVERLLEETSAGTVCETIEECSALLRQWYHQWLAGKPLVIPNAHAIARYERRNAAKQLAMVFDSLCTASS